jgi:hypothetical protein
LRDLIRNFKNQARQKLPFMGIFTETLGSSWPTSRKTLQNFEPMVRHWDIFLIRFLGRPELAELFRGFPGAIILKGGHPVLTFAFARWMSIAAGGAFPDQSDIPTQRDNYYLIMGRSTSLEWWATPLR